MIKYDPLLLLANSFEEYVLSLQKKLIKQAEENGHSMIIETPYLIGVFGSGWTKTYFAYCSKCSFQVDLEHCHYEGENRDNVSTTYYGIHKKCK